MEINNRFLFKAKRIDNGEWVQGFYYVFMGKHYIFEQPFENNNLTHQVDESTICQCTGLRDKNGRLIFENDILKVVQLSIGTRSMHLGHLQEKDGCITISSEKHKIQKSV